MPDNKFSLTRLQRLFLSNQYRILEALYPDQADDYAVRREAIELGYELLYDWDVEYIYDGEDILTKEESLEVWNTFDMFDALRRSADNLGKLDWLLEQPNSSFMGYDGNHETKFMAFSEFTIERLQRFRYIALPANNYFNSHRPMRPMYRDMLARWHEISDANRLELTEDQIKHILGVTE